MFVESEFNIILTAIFAKTTPVNAKTVRVSYRKSSYGAATKIQIVRTIKANTNGAEKKFSNLRSFEVKG